MASFKVTGKRGAARRLVDLIKEANPGIIEEATGDGLSLWGPRIVLRREMFGQAYFPQGVKHPRNVGRFFRAALLWGGPLLRLTDDEIIFGDTPPADRTFLARFPPELKEEIEKYSKKLGLSQNDFILLALRDFLEFLREQEGGDGPAGGEGPKRDQPKPDDSTQDEPTKLGGA